MSARFLFLGDSLDVFNPYLQNHGGRTETIHQELANTLRSTLQSLNSPAFSQGLAQPDYRRAGA